MSKKSKDNNLENQSNESSSFIPEIKQEETVQPKAVVTPKSKEKQKIQKNKKPSTKLVPKKKKHNQFSRIRSVDGVQFY